MAGGASLNVHMLLVGVFHGGEAEAPRRSLLLCSRLAVINAGAVGKQRLQPISESSACTRSIYQISLVPRRL